MVKIKVIGGTRPIRIRVGTLLRQYWITVYPNGDVEIKPLGSRSLEATVSVTTSAIYERVMLNRARPKPRQTRGVLATERKYTP